jgi:hypothetical protein
MQMFQKKMKIMKMKMKIKKNPLKFKHKIDKKFSINKILIIMLLNLPL